MKLRVLLCALLLLPCIGASAQSLVINPITGKLECCAAIAGSESGTVTTSGTITTGAVVTAAGATSIQTPSAGATVDSSGNLVVNSVTTATSGSIGGGWNFLEGTCSTGLASNDLICADSTAHRLTENANNAGKVILSGIASAGVSGNCVELAANGIDLIDAGAVCGSGGGGSAFSAITSGTNTASTMTVGTGATLTVSGGGVNNANELNGAAISASLPLASINSSKQIVAATAHNVAAVMDCADTSGSGTAQVCNTAVAFTPVAGDSIIYETSTTNTGSLTINVNGSGAATAKKNQGQLSLAAGDLNAGISVLMTFDGAFWEMYNTAAVNPASATILGTNSNRQTAAAALLSGDFYVGNVSNLPVAVAMSGDVTLANTGAVTLATVNSGPGSCGDSTHVCQVTTNGKGLVTTQSAVAISAGTVTTFSAGNLSPLFTTNVATATSAPALTFTLSNAAAGTLFGNATSSSAAPAFTTTPILGASGTLGSITFGNATSGLVTLQPVAGALGTVTASLPANTGTLAELNFAQTWSATQTFSGGNLFGGGVNAQTGTTYTIVVGDENKLVTYSNAVSVAVTLPVATTSGFVSGAIFHQKNIGVGAVTITPTTSTINGAATLVLTTSQDATIYSDGTNYWATVDTGTGNTVTGGTCTNQVATAIAAITGAPTCTTITPAYASGNTSGSGNFVLVTSPTLITPALGTPTALVLTSATGLPTGGLVNNAVTSAKMAVVNTRRVCDIPVGDTSASAITTGQLGPQKRLCYIPAAATVVEMDVAADAGTPNVIVAVNHAGTDSNIVSGALATASSGGIACSNTGGTTGIDGATTCSSTLQNTSMLAGDYLELVSGTPGGTAKLMTIHIIYTIN